MTTISLKNHIKHPAPKGAICASVLLFALANANPAQNPTQSPAQNSTQNLQYKKSYLEEQLKELENREKIQNEIETMQGKIQYLQQKQQAQQEQSETQVDSTQEATLPNASDLAQQTDLAGQVDCVQNGDTPCVPAQNQEASAQNPNIHFEPMNKEKSGLFVGVSAGIASFGADFVVSYYGTSKTTNQNGRFSSSGSFGNATGIYGLMVGYKHGITGGFGLRYYADFNYLYATKEKIHSMNYALNIDGLLNIVEKNHNFFGFFAGVGVGAQTHIWSDRLLESKLDEVAEAAGTKGVILHGDAKINYETNKQDFKNPFTSLNVALNFGIRASFAKHHDVELGVRFRPLRSKLIEASLEGGTMNTTNFGLKSLMGSPYDIFLRYVYVF